ncbi:uncharacterized protein LOC130922882 [Corythoichthys intestinalis]|uniref:uncharacterized protein LOC130922882 n=1 Tax=Corythoichthys intestinalis TaxID=161448 RepID=UPI0025A582BD|nr:uncharacterized protein LOC130922882 [Corythoichthys intestinalis]
MKRSQNIETFFIVKKKKRSAAGDSGATASSSGQHSAEILISEGDSHSDEDPQASICESGSDTDEAPHSPLPTSSQSSDISRCPTDGPTRPYLRMYPRKRFCAIYYHRDGYCSKCLDCSVRCGSSSTFSTFSERGLYSIFNLAG